MTLVHKRTLTTCGFATGCMLQERQAIEMQNGMAIQVEVQTTCYADERLLGKSLALSLEQGHEL